jgi:hypothetical protein
MLQVCFANLSIADGAHREGKPFVAAPVVNSNMVNRSAPDLFPLICLVKKSYIRRKTWTIAPAVWTRAIRSNILKTDSFLSLTKCSLNRI